MATDPQPERTIAEICADQRRAQGLPVKIDNPLAYRDLAILLGHTATKKATRPSAA